MNRRCALGEAARRIGIGIDEDVAVVEGGRSLIVGRKQHAVAEHVARHVADADDGERRGLDVDVELAEVALDRFPGAARGDAHLLVVVAGRAAGGEGVAEPEAVLERDGVGDVGEGGGALVGGDHQIGIVVVVAHDVGRAARSRRPAEIVGDVEQAARRRSCRRRCLRRWTASRSALGRLLGHEAALGADRHDDGVLDLLRLDQAEHLGAEILRPVGPAQAAARDLAEAQVHAFDARRIDENLVERSWQRQLVDLAART